MFWAALGLGVLLTGVVFALSFVAGHFFDDPMVGTLLQVLCLTFILEELTVIPRSLMARMMMFRADFAVQAYTLALNTKVVARVVQGGETVDQSLAWLERELTNIRRGG